MKQSLNKYHLSEEEMNMVKVFMLLYGYDSVEELIGKTENELKKHKGWNNEIVACIEKMKNRTD